MTQGEEQPLEPPYSEADLAEFARILGIRELSPDLSRQMQRAAYIYEVLDGTDRMRATRSERRTAFRRIRDAASDLKQALADLRQMMIDERVRLPLSDSRELDELAQAAGGAAQRVPVSGRDPKLARKIFIENIGRIYKSATGKRLGLSRDKYGKSGGPFFRFAEAALKRLDQHAVQGMESDVSAVAKEYRKSRPVNRAE